MYTEETLKVKTFNAEMIKAIISLVPHEENQEYRINVAGIIENVIIDDECIYSFMEPRFHKGKIELVYDIPVYLRTKTEEAWSSKMTPHFYYPFSESELNEFYKGEVSLMEFMGSRYNYNGRIKTNMKQFLKLYNECQQVPEIVEGS